MNNYKKSLHRILQEDYGVRSGVYSAIEPSIRMEMNARGEYEPVFTKTLGEEAYKRLLRVDMMSNESKNESEIGKKLFGTIKSIRRDPIIGYYKNLYAGYVKKGGFRERGSSGGMCSWLLSELLTKKVVDGVIHFQAVEPKENQGLLFKYTVSRSQKDIKQGAKSRYYPGELSGVLREVKRVPGKYAVVGIPEFITELRLLADEDPIIKERLTVMVGLVCGHQKTAKYVESLAWQHGIKPGDLHSVDFRIKQPDSTAIDYLHEFTGDINGETKTIHKKHSELFGEVWAYGFFKSKFSDFSDNVFNEVADVVLGDAWLPQYNKDGMGNNIVITRNEMIDQIISEGIASGALKLDTVDATTIKQSQQGLIHHGRDELPYRLNTQKKKHGWVPKKRVEKTKKMPLIRQHIQQVRYEMARKSHGYYQEALARNDWHYFKSAMIPMVNQYTKLYGMKSGVLARNRVKSSARDIEYLVDSARISLRPRSRLRSLKHKTRVRTRVRETATSLRRKREAARVDKLRQSPQGAILTLTGYFNYGNMLQRYALQRYLLNHGKRFISYAQESLDTSGKEFDRLRNTIPFVETRIVRKPFDKNDTFPAYIAGSDQIWRKWGVDESLDSVKYYFFDFLKNRNVKRVVYAASFGHADIKEARLTDQFMEEMKPLVKKIDAISMREKSGVEIAHKRWGVNAKLTVDPTMLLGDKDYSRLIEDTIKPTDVSKPGFAYILHDSAERRQDLQRIFAGHNLEYSGVYLKTTKPLPSVEQWLQNIRDAQLVVTDSFHGIVFSIIFKTPFIVVVNEFGGISRIETLLREFGLEDRLIRDDMMQEYQAGSLAEIDWTRIDKKMKKLRKDSGRWLLRSLQ